MGLVGGGASAQWVVSSCGKKAILILCPLCLNRESVSILTNAKLYAREKRNGESAFFIGEGFGAGEGGSFRRRVGGSAGKDGVCAAGAGPGDGEVVGVGFTEFGEGKF